MARSHLGVTAGDEAAAQTPAVKFTSGGAKFVSSGFGMRPGVQRPAKQLPAGVVDLMAPPAGSKPASGVSFGDLKKRQADLQREIISQRNGSASLPRHNDVPRLDAQIGY